MHTYVHVYMYVCMCVRVFMCLLVSVKLTDSSASHLIFVSSDLICKVTEHLPRRRQRQRQRHMLDMH